MHRLSVIALAVGAALALGAQRAEAQPVVGAKAFVGVEVGASRLEVAEGLSQDGRFESDSKGLTYAVEAGVSLPVQLTIGAFFRRYDGDVRSAGDESVTWGMDANEIGVLAEWTFPIGPASLIGVSTGIGGQASLLAIDGARNAEDLVETAIAGEVLAGRVYGFVGLPVQSRISLLARAGWVIAEVSAENFEDGLSEQQPGNAADYGGFFVAGALRVTLF